MRKHRYLLIGLATVGILLLGGAGWPQATEQSSIKVIIDPDKPLVAPGDTVTCSFTVIITGDLAVFDLVLRDDFGNTIPLSTTSLAPGQTASASYAYQVREEDLPGPFTIGVTVSGKDKYGQKVEANAYSRIPMVGISLEKTPSKNVARPGEAVTYIYTITNTGSSTLTLSRIEDDRIGTIDISGQKLAPGTSVSIRSVPYTLPDEPSGEVVNVATVYGTATAENSSVEVTASASALVVLVEVVLEKSVDPAEAYVGQTVVFTITVSNEGTRAWDLRLVDPLLGVEENLTLGPGESWKGIYEYVIPSDAGGIIRNVVILRHENPDWEMEDDAEVVVKRPENPGPFDPDDPRNQPWDVSFAVVKVFDTQVFDGKRLAMRLLDGHYQPLKTVPISGNLYLEVTDLDQNEKPLMAELIFGGWSRDAVAGEAAALGNSVGGTPTREEDSAPVWDLSGKEGHPDPNTSDRMSPHCDPSHPMGLRPFSITGIPATVKVLVWNAQRGTWERMDLKETAPNSGIFRSTTCVLVSDLRHPGEGNLASRPGDTIFALYQDPSNHSDVALAMVKVSEGGAAPVTPGAISVQFDRETYAPGETAVITVVDPDHAGMDAITGSDVLVLELDGEILFSWDEIPAVPGGVPGHFAVSYTIPQDISGTLRAVYVSPVAGAPRAEATAQIIAGTLHAVRALDLQPGNAVFADRVTFALQTDPPGIPVETIELLIFDLLGRRVVSLGAEGAISISWDGRDSRGEEVRNGAYIYVLVVEDPHLEGAVVFRGFVYPKR